MAHIYDNTVLLYRILSEERRVEFINVINEKNTLNSLTAKDIVSIDFDELLRETKDFHKYYSQIKTILLNQIKEVNYSAFDIPQKIIALDNYNNSSNFITTYYLNKFRSLLPAESSFIYNRTVLKNKQKAKSKIRIEKMIQNIETVTDPEFFSHFSSISNHELIKESDFIIRERSEYEYSSRAVIYFDNVPTLFNVADTSLINFYYDFSYELYKSEMSIGVCEFCHNEFLGSKGIRYCSNPQCQKTYFKIVKNQNEKIRRNSPYVKPITTIDNYISTNKSIFLKKVNKDPKMKLKFEKVEKKVKEDIRDEIKRRKINGLPPNDDSLDGFIKNQKETILHLIWKLLKEYDNNNS
ncbi:hypothetical protein [Ruminococcus flavefaciens]|uniref:Uncharacterized protein n=1 Tax=Ruminococcus flavefaciens TaxID=1265 RepID=A0A1M7MHR5_RUMFL|nr:hypothetical protein [Ruminococcus flavefaciens]SHM89979.1 hypothetical protein SAMN04487860_12241 [Ruminococcus flavefaciens]